MPMICSASWTMLRRHLRRRHLDVVHLERPAHGEQLLHAGRARHDLVELGGLAVHVVAHRLQRRPRARARCVAFGGTTPGFLRASARTKARRARERRRSRCRATRADHRMCEYDTIVCADASANEPGSTCASGPDDVSLKPGLHVPRMPIVSQVVVCVERAVALAHEHEDLIARRRVRRRGGGHEQVVGVLARTTRSSRPCRA